MSSTPRPFTRTALLGALSLLLLATAPRHPARSAELATAPAPAAPSETARHIRIAAGATLDGVLTDAGVEAGEAHDAIDALRPLWDPRKLQPGQEITLHLAGEALQELRLPLAIDRDVVVARSGDGQFAARMQQQPLTAVPEIAAGVIQSSLFEAASTAGLPMPVLTGMVQALSYDVDFQRDLQPEDSFEVLYDRLYDDQGHAVGIGDITYVEMTLSGKTLRLYRFEPPGATAPLFFNEAGESVKKALLRTPVDGARLSSVYGMRLHPILGYTKMHRGVDFAAPRGTPIMAAGDGVVEHAGPEGSYGNFVLLHHSGPYETAYAHMSRIARGIRPGRHVHQGQIIGYVGATGRATGPHLHYEVRIDGRQVNPMGVKLRPSAPLTGKPLVAFRAARAAIDREVLTLRRATLVADLPPPRGDE